MKYKGWEILKMIEEGKIKESTILTDNYQKYFVQGGHLKHMNNKQYVDCWNLIANEFEIEEQPEEINIQDIKELKKDFEVEILGASDCFEGNELYWLNTFSKNDTTLLIYCKEIHNKMQEIIKALKQLDKKIEEK